MLHNLIFRGADPLVRDALCPIPTRAPTGCRSNCPPSASSRYPVGNDSGPGLSALWQQPALRDGNCSGHSPALARRADAGLLMNAGSAKRLRTPTKLLGLPTPRVSCATVPSLPVASTTHNFPAPKDLSANPATRLRLVLP